MNPTTYLWNTCSSSPTPGTTGHQTKYIRGQLGGTDGDLMCTLPPPPLLPPRMGFYSILHFSLYVKDSIIKEKPGERDALHPQTKDRFQSGHTEEKPGSSHSSTTEAVPGCVCHRLQGLIYLWDATGVALVQNPLGYGSVALIQTHLLQ